MLESLSRSLGDSFAILQNDLVFFHFQGRDLVFTVGDYLGRRAEIAEGQPAPSKGSS